MVPELSEDDDDVWQEVVADARTMQSAIGKRHRRHGGTVVGGTALIFLLLRWMLVDGMCWWRLVLCWCSVFIDGGSTIGVA